MAHNTINLARDFTKFPGGRFRSDGPFSGEEFREDYLLPALQNYENVTVILDGVAGLPSSFQEEAFGGLVPTGSSGEQSQVWCARDLLWKITFRAM